MLKIKTKRIVLTLAGLAIFGLCLIGKNYLVQVDFNDNPALLVGLSDEGLATLDTYTGTISGRLKGVLWTNDPLFLSNMKVLLKEAQKDQVAFSQSKEGEIKIWYQGNSGPQSLNEKLNASSQKAIIK